MMKPAILITGGVKFVKKDDYDALQQRLTTLEAAVRALVDAVKEANKEAGMCPRGIVRPLIDAQHALAEPQGGGE